MCDTFVHINIAGYFHFCSTFWLLADSCWLYVNVSGVPDLVFFEILNGMKMFPKIIHFMECSVILENEIRKLKNQKQNKLNSLSRGIHEKLLLHTSILTKSMPLCVRVCIYDGVCKARHASAIKLKATKIDVLLSKLLRRNREPNIHLGPLWLYNCSCLLECWKDPATITYPQIKKFT